MTFLEGLASREECMVVRIVEGEKVCRVIFWPSKGHFEMMQLRKPCSRIFLYTACRLVCNGNSAPASREGLYMAGESGFYSAEVWMEGITVHDRTDS